MPHCSFLQTIRPRQPTGEQPLLLLPGLCLWRAFSRFGGDRALHNAQSYNFRSPVSDHIICFTIPNSLVFLRISCRLLPQCSIPLLHSGPSGPLALMHCKNDTVPGSAFVCLNRPHLYRFIRKFLELRYGLRMLLTGTQLLRVRLNSASSLDRSLSILASVFPRKSFIPPIQISVSCREASTCYGVGWQVLDWKTKGLTTFQFHYLDGWSMKFFVVVFCFLY